MIEDLRKRITEIDIKMMELFKLRAEASIKIGEYKKENNLPIIDSKREEEMLNNYQKLFGDDELWVEYKRLFKEILLISKELQK